MAGEQRDFIGGYGEKSGGPGGRVAGGSADCDIGGGELRRGPKQAGAHLLRDIHDLRSLYPDDGSLSQWADAVHQLYRQATAFTHPAEQQRRTAKMALERRLLVLCRPFLDDPSAVQARLCRRMEIKDSSSSWPNRRCRRTTTPPSAASAIWWSAARSVGAPARTGVCHQDESIFGTWRAQGLNTLNACRQLLASPQV